MLRPPSSSVLPRWWVGALALVWGSMTPMLTSGGGQTLAMGSPITGPARVMLWVVGGRLRGAWDAHNEKRDPLAHLREDPVGCNGGVADLQNAECLGFDGITCTNAP